MGWEVALNSLTVATGPPLHSHPHLPGWESSPWLAVPTLRGQVTGQRPPPHPRPQSCCLGKGRATVCYTPCHGARSPLLGWRGVASASGGFPEPAAPSYGAPGVEFMGLHRENNAVVQIYFLPGQVRAPPHPSYSHIFPKERQASGGPGCGAAGRTWDHHPSP